MNATIFTFEKLYQAYLDCRRTKRKTINALKFEWNLERNLFKLQRELEARTYRPGRSICFVAKEPSPREIFAASFRDRVVHHLLINEIESMGEKRFIFDTFSCRKNKGTHLAIKKLKKFIRKATGNYKREAFYLQLDISGFFMAIEHHILYSLLEKMIFKQNKSYQWTPTLPPPSCLRQAPEDILWLAKTIIFHKPTKNYIIKGSPSLFKLIPSRKSLFKSPKDKGLPIGNYSSQFFANLYLNELDQFIKRGLTCPPEPSAQADGRRECRYYIRYVDDLVLLDESREKLKYLKDKINLFLKKNLDLELSLNKTKLQPIDKGIDFLGYFVKPDCILVRQKVVKRLKNKLYQLNKILNSEFKIPDSKILAMINSYYGHFKHAFSFNLRKDIYENHLGKLKEIFLPAQNYSFLKIKHE